MNTLRLLFIFIFILILVPDLQSQIHIFNNTNCKNDIGLLLGYDYNFEDIDLEKYEFLEIGLIKTRYDTVSYTSSYSIYYSNEIGLNTKNITWGPKIGGYLSFWRGVIGLETILYTDFQDESFRISPYFGIGFYNFKLSINPQIKISKSDFPVNWVNFNLMVKILNIKKQRILHPSKLNQ